MFDLKAQCIIIFFLLFSCSVVSDSATPWHAAGFSVLLCLSPSPWVYSNSCSLSQWCHPTTSSSVAPFSSCPQSPPASGSSPVSQLFASGDQSLGPSASAPVLLMSIQGWFPFRLIGLISLQSKGLVSSTTVWRHQFFSAQLFLLSALTSVHDYSKNHSFDCTDLCPQNDVFAF